VKGPGSLSFRQWQRRGIDGEWERTLVPTEQEVGKRGAPGPIYKGNGDEGELGGKWKSRPLFCVREGVYNPVEKPF